MPIVTYDQDNAYLYNEDGEPVGKIFREGDGLGPLIEERVNGWLELSSERDKLREQVKILREAAQRVIDNWDGGDLADSVRELSLILEATKEA